MEHILSKCTFVFAKEMGKELDAILREAVTKVIGHQWSMDSIDVRLELVCVLGKDHQFFFLDHHPIVELFPVEMTTEQRDDSIVMVATRKYRILV